MAHHHVKRSSLFHFKDSHSHKKSVSQAAFLLSKKGSVKATLLSLVILAAGRTINKKCIQESKRRESTPPLVPSRSLSRSHKAGRQAGRHPSVHYTSVVEKLLKPGSLGMDTAVFRRKQRSNIN